MYTCSNQSVTIDESHAPITVPHSILVQDVKFGSLKSMNSKFSSKANQECVHLINISREPITASNFLYVQDVTARLFNVV